RKDLKPLLAVAKKSRRYGWLKEYDSIALQQAVINLDVAFSNFFNPKLKARFPTFKSKHGRQSSYHCVGIKVIDGAIKIPKIAPIEARLHREMTGALKSITLGSANRRKARIQLAGVHERVANARADFQHKLSRAIVDENQAVIVETLKSANMMKNHCLARAIGDAGWHGF
uniref:RNA-guided endonuclease InsQ/TnpB family protein n=2 Tax=unclassified Shigella TaxID=2629414 RepID=UPI000B0D2128